MDMKRILVAEKLLAEVTAKMNDLHDQSVAETVVQALKEAASLIGEECEELSK